jgi:hypothetical protein
MRSLRKLTLLLLLACGPSPRPGLTCSTAGAFVCSQNYPGDTSALFCEQNAGRLSGVADGLVWYPYGCNVGCTADECKFSGQEEECPRTRAGQSVCGPAGLNTNTLTFAPALAAGKAGPAKTPAPRQLP